jgi:hypothetical protein
VKTYATEQSAIDTGVLIILLRTFTCASFSGVWKSFNLFRTKPLHSNLEIISPTCPTTTTTTVVS